MGFDHNNYDGFAKRKAATPLVDIVCLYQCTKHPMRYVDTTSKYGHLVGIPDYDNQKSFSRAARGKVWVEEILFH